MQKIHGEQNIRILHKTGLLTVPCQALSELYTKRKISNIDPVFI